MSSSFTNVDLDNPSPPRWPERVTSIVMSLAVLGYLILPGIWQWSTAATEAAKTKNVVAQVTPIIPPTSDTGLANQLRTAPTSLQASPIILTYHDVGYRHNQYSVTPEVFAGQMQLLADAGWTTITAAQLSDWLTGHPLPPHAVMITFDDGVRGVWRYADPILARNHQHASAYIITGFVGTNAPYYMTWQEITALQSSGRWDIEAHTHLGHVQIPTGPAGKQGPFLTNLQYLASESRVETVDEYRKRITQDLIECKKQIIARRLPEPTFFAYPFSAQAGTPALTEILTTTVKSLFHGAMLDDAGTARTTTASELVDGNLERMDITSDVSVADWAAKLFNASPLDPPTAAPFTRTTDWTTNDGAPATLPIHDQALALDPGPGHYTIRKFAPAQTSIWHSYSVTATLGGFRRAGDGTTSGLVVLSDDAQQIELTLSDGSFQMRQGLDANERILAAGTLPLASAYPVEITVRPDSVAIRISGRLIRSIPLRPNGTYSPAGGIAIAGKRENIDSPIPQISNIAVH